MADLCTQTLPEHWKYVAEGGASMVFSYRGPVHPTYTGRVLRLRKVPLNSVEAELNSTEESQDHAGYSIAFDDAVIRRLIPEQFLPRLESVLMDSKWLETLSQLTEHERPRERRTKHTVDTRQTRALLAPDLLGNEGIAVEIKPKWGFLPSPAYLSPSTRPIKARTCRFCMHTHMKYAECETVAVTFCPLDLYSGDETRVRRALLALWDSWIASPGEINNLRVFTGGRLVRFTHDSAAFIDIARVLDSYSSSTQLDPRSQPEDLRDRLISSLIPPLLEMPVLRILSSLQRTLDKLDIEGLASLWARAHAAIIPAPALGEGLSEPTLEEWTLFIEEYFSKTSTAVESELHVHELRHYCLAYLLSATFKDCSIMVKIDFPNVNRDNVKTSLHIIDLDVKSISRLAKWQKLDREIVAAYANVEPRNCVDQWAPQ
ncbi:uncharacterized protein LAESUDRAFT_712226 [Laetiporus sulphureus 93-53]|uniref:Inositol-pentakisphosphate 2-kinase n=1 Tax=Laetiporus sulphureus 93-53 TaxID=1314785 RepID=A0A165G3K4_9APHY|nr:uncharacterized protein LAESUDRAFT_712226 [Laetiporus sulphureus 93-53]KZT09780.1 hypothetical protein LAESUDRAFT_712226 [Laetiporus sulphureus 93-53]